MKAYTNTIHSKQSAVALADLHFQQDNYLQGTFTEGQKGCSVGCMTRAYVGEQECGWHEATEPLFGIPRVLSKMQDRIFEGLAVEESKLWTQRFMGSINEGADLSMVVPKLLLWLMTDADGFRKHAKPETIETLDKIAQMYELKIHGNNPSYKEWREVADKAWDQRKKLRDADAYADAYAYAVRQAFWKKVSDKLIEILLETK